METMTLLDKIWDAQKQYNDTIKAIQADKESHWTEVYLLGVVSQVNELLKETNWKRNSSRASSAKINRANLGFELADMTKYILCLWQECGFSAEEMLVYVWGRTVDLDLSLRAEFFPPTGQRVIVTDLDGTMADYRAGLLKFAGWERDDVKTLSIDSDNGIPYREYRDLQNRFEEGGGYAYLPPYADGVELVKAEQRNGSYVLVTTARPNNQLRRIYNDTMSWLERQRIAPDAIVWGRDERIVKLLELGRDNEVVLLEDEPILALRAARSGVPVLMRAQGYNADISHPLILRVPVFPARLNWDLLREMRDSWQKEQKDA